MLDWRSKTIRKDQGIKDRGTKDRGIGPGTAGAARGWGVILCLVLSLPSQYALGGAADAGAADASGAATGDPLAEQRSHFLEARRAWRRGQGQRYRQLAAKLSGYPLYPYLRHTELSAAGGTQRLPEVMEFLRAYPEFPLNARLRNRWLERLAGRGRWADFLSLYDARDAPSARLQCLALKARIELGRTEGLAADTVPLFQVGHSQPTVCDPAFRLLYASPLMNDELLWERIRLALAKGNAGLARYLGRRLSPQQQPILQQWLHMHAQPERGTRQPRLADTPLHREILRHGIGRLAARQLSQAITRWQRIRADYSYSEEEAQPLIRQLAVRAVRRKHPQALALLDAVRNPDQEMLDWQLRAALRGRAWERLETWTREEPPPEVNALQWRYWHGRALEELGAKAQARQALAPLAKKRDYYGFLAADRMGMTYSMQYLSTPRDEQATTELLATPGLRRAREWRLLGEMRAARREWQHVMRRLDTHRLQIAARLAAGWGWHDRAIFALGQAGAHDDLELRFPVLFEDLVSEQAERRQLDRSWIFGVMRAESAFMADAYSRAGARGLMQIMPNTGRLTARKLGMRNFHTSQLMQPKVSLSLGSAYLKMLYEDLGNKIVLATAGYNAGPGRVRSWLRNQDCTAPDVWIETIPFQETRRYVKRVLFYSSIYDWRLQRPVVPVAARAAGAIGGNGRSDCPANVVSLQP